jgi:hypothetical protein
MGAGEGTDDRRIKEGGGMHHRHRKGMEDENELDESFGGNVIRRSSDEKEIRKLRLKWVLGNVRHHMSNLALWPRSLLGKATRDNAPTSTEFLVQVTSMAAGDDGICPLLEDDALDQLRSSIDHEDKMLHICIKVCGICPDTYYNMICRCIS